MTETSRTKEHNLHISAVYMRPTGNDLYYTCQWRNEAGGWTCGGCGLGALGPEPKVGDVCDNCALHVAAIRRGPPEPVLTRERYL